MHPIHIATEKEDEKRGRDHKKGEDDFDDVAVAQAVADEQDEHGEQHYADAHLQKSGVDSDGEHQQPVVPFFAADGSVGGALPLLRPENQRDKQAEHHKSDDGAEDGGVDFNGPKRAGYGADDNGNEKPEALLEEDFDAGVPPQTTDAHHGSRQRADAVGGVGGVGGQSEENQQREGDGRAVSREGVDDAGDEAAEEEEGDFGGSNSE